MTFIFVHSLNVCVGTGLKNSGSAGLCLLQLFKSPLVSASSSHAIKEQDAKNNIQLKEMCWFCYLRSKHYNNTTFYIVINISILYLLVISYTDQFRNDESWSHTSGWHYRCETVALTALWCICQKPFSTCCALKLVPVKLSWPVSHIAGRWLCKSCLYVITIMGSSLLQWMMIQTAPTCLH